MTPKFIAFLLLWLKNVTAVWNPPNAISTCTNKEVDHKLSSCFYKHVGTALTKTVEYFDNKNIIMIFDIDIYSKVGKLPAVRQYS